VEAQGRENLYDLTLPNGDVLRSIQPVRDDVALNDDVEWSISGDRILVFDETGARL
jgi:inositol-phosphate transport system ATP-binding protein